MLKYRAPSCIADEFNPCYSKISFNSSQHETPIIAIHFDKPSSSVPVKEGSKALLVPVAIKDGAKVENKALEKLHYIYLTEQAPVEPEFYALLILSS